MVKAGKWPKPAVYYSNLDASLRCAGVEPPSNAMWGNCSRDGTLKHGMKCQLQCKDGYVMFDNKGKFQPHCDKGNLTMRVICRNHPKLTAAAAAAAAVAAAAAESTDQLSHNCAESGADNKSCPADVTNDEEEMEECDCSDPGCMCEGEADDDDEREVEGEVAYGARPGRAAQKIEWGEV